MRRKSRFAKWSLCLAALTSAAIAQQAPQPTDDTANNASVTVPQNQPPAQVNGQVQSQQPRYPVTPGGGQMVDTRVGQELYGNRNTVSPLYGPQVQPLPSETRMAIQRSGALPSEILINSQTVGPLSPNGAMDYVPTQSPLQRAMGTPPLNLWGPAYAKPGQVPMGPGAPVLQNGALPGSSGAAFGQSPLNNGNVNAFSNRTVTTPANGYVQPPPPQYVNRYIQPQSVSAGYLVPPTPYRSAAVPGETTTTTIIIRHRLATTEPTTRSLSDEH